MIDQHGVSFKILGLSDIRKETHCDDIGIATWIKREPCHGAHGLFTPLEQCIEEAREDIVKEANKDPLPQFTSRDIQDTTDFLNAAITAMDSFASTFAAAGADLKAISDHQLQTQQQKVRESSRCLGVLLAGTRAEFSGMESTLAITETEQVGETRAQLDKLHSFVQTFGHAEWLGIMLATEEFSEKKAMAEKMLEGLLQPSKVSLENMPAVDELLQSALRVLSGSNDAQRHGSVQHINALVKMSMDLASELQGIQEKWSEMQQEMRIKMDRLHFFAETLMLFRKSLNRYLLVRLGEIDDAQDLSILKQWIGHREANEVHRLLEAFRDAANIELAVRQLRGYPVQGERASSVASSAEFHVVATEEAHDQDE